VTHIRDWLITGSTVLNNLATVNANRLASFLLDKTTTGSYEKTLVAVLNALMSTKYAHVSKCQKVSLFRMEV
jgi:hypothetical protein